MKKVILIVTVFLSINSLMSAQVIQQSNYLFSAGYGWPNWTSVLADSLPQNGKKISEGPFHFKVEYRPVSVFSFALSINYNYVNVTGIETNSYLPGVPSAYTSNESLGTLSILLRLNYHESLSERSDLYLGAGLGKKFYNYSFVTNDPGIFNPILNTGLYGINVGFEGTLGFRYYFSSDVGAYIEGGIAQSLIQGGIVIKLIPQNIQKPAPQNQPMKNF